MAQQAVQETNVVVRRRRARGVSRDLATLRIGFVNVAFIGDPDAGDRGWVLVDAGLPGSARLIAQAAAERFGPEARPAAIVLTHGHFDHVGAVRDLADRWDAPIYAHPLERPFLTGRAAYPPPDPTVGGGAMARLSPLYPKGPFDISNRLQALPPDGSVPGAPGWRWIFTPGHSPGHVSLFRDEDRAVIAGDAFVTTKQESAIAAVMYRPELHGPPAYFTPDWRAARESVKRLADLEPEVAITGHGPVFRGSALRSGLFELAARFDELAMPRHGRYVAEPAVTDENGVVRVPPPVEDPLPKYLLGAGAVLLLALALRGARRRR